jgi:hypothetical protein
MSENWLGSERSASHFEIFFMKEFDYIKVEIGT